MNNLHFMIHFIDVHMYVRNVTRYLDIRSLLFSETLQLGSALGVLKSVPSGFLKKIQKLAISGKNCQKMAIFAKNPVFEGV